MTEHIILSFDETELFVRETGTGTPILFLHGACEDGCFFLHLAEQLQTQYRCILPDRRGYGRSGAGKNEDLNRTEQNAKDAEVILRELCPGEPVYLFGHSAGSIIGMQSMTDHPDSVLKAVFYEPPAPMGLITDEEKRNTLAEVEALIESKKFSKALKLFMPLIGPADNRALPQSEEELKYAVRNCKAFMRDEYVPIFHHPIDPAPLKQQDITVLVGNLGISYPRYDETVRVANSLDAALKHCSGSHNAPRDIPVEIAGMVREILEA